LRPLCWSQIIWRVKRVAENKLVRIVPGRRAARVVTPGDCVAEDAFPLVPISGEGNRSGDEILDRLERGVFYHHHQSRQLGQASPDWQLGSQASDRLWIVTLHYHRWAYELAEQILKNRDSAERARGLLEHYLSDWIRNCDISDPGVQPLAWNSYAIATRLGWWIRTYFVLTAQREPPRDRFLTAMLSSLFRQAVHLHRHVEWDLRANHLMRDAVGLAWAGRFFRGPEARRWLARATKLAADQAVEQVLPDGAHFELSPMYHLDVMHDLLSLAILLTDPDTTALLRTTWGRMAEYIAWLCHPDGHLVQFNDGARRRPFETLSMAPSLGFESLRQVTAGGRHFADSGVLAWHGRPWTVFFDMGPVGPACQPGHAHADTLTLECSFGDRRLFVDPGCHSYDNDVRRSYDRSTEAHNTVSIDGIDSSEVWDIFRVGRRARPLNVQVTLGTTDVEAAAGHDGYAHLSGAPRPHRTIHALDHGPLEIHDRIEGQGNHTVTGGLLLAPEWNANPAAGGWILTSAGTSLRVSVESTSPLTLDIEDCPLHPDYGLELPTQRLVWRYQGDLPMEVHLRVDHA
jgi:uncharacterized heparinase superfamily protein